MAAIVFMGTPDFAIPTLTSLIEYHTVVGVVTQPDRPAGRGGQLQQSPVKQLALSQTIPVFQPEKLRRPEAIATLHAWQADVFIVAAFGQILPQAVLDMPKHGCINVHGSLLPRWRGAAPIQAAIRAGDAETGITIMEMDAGLDTGAMLAQRAIPILPDETGKSLHDKMAVLGAELLIETLPTYLAGVLTPQPQDNRLATLAPQITKEEGRIQWTHDAASIERLVRAFTPWPGTYAYWNGKQLKIHAGSVTDGSAEAGKVIQQDGQVAIGTGAGLFLPREVQLEGKKRTTIADFVNGYGDFVGARLE